MSWVTILAALGEAEELLENYAPYGIAALAALKAGGIAGLITYLEALAKTPIPAGPPVAEVQKVIASLKAAHA